MRPYLFHGAVSKQNVIERESVTSRRETVQYGNSYNNPADFGFRFIGDFSNSFLQSYAGYQPSSSSIKFLTPPFSQRISDDADDLLGYNANKQILVGSKEIHYFKTNSAGTVYSVDGNGLFIKPVANGLQRLQHIGNSSGYNYGSIAGFSITNESGVTYHYNLPANVYDEEVYQENAYKINSSDLKFNRQTKSAGYAYIWHLTAITGPDYVDRGIVGELDSEDYGYWISFEYGKWSDEYVWRTPTQGFTKNMEDQFKTVSMGKKEVYYLNAIRTRSHVALFEKELRLDGKSASKESFNKNWSTQNSVYTDYINEGLYNVNSNQSLRLSHIYILKNEPANQISLSLGGSAGLIPTGRTVACNTCELPGNILDKNDVDAYGRAGLESKSLRIIDFEYDYSLAKGSMTSFNPQSPTAKLGKLTLKSFKTRGLGGMNILPSTKFGYELSTEERNSGTGTLSSNRISNANVRYEVGDLIESDEAQPVFYGSISSVTQTGSTYTYSISGGESLSNLGVKKIRRTKNPPYQRDKYDYWGMYKVDYIYNSSENYARMPTKRSIKSVDVWSLRTIKTATGAMVRIAYEGHDFSRSIYGSNQSVRFTNMTKLPAARRYLLSGESGSLFYQGGDHIQGLVFRKFDFQGSTYCDAIDDVVMKVIGFAEYGEMEIELDYETEMSIFDDGVYTGASAEIMAVYVSPTPISKDRIGGAGVRVKSVGIQSLDGVRYYTDYYYHLENTNRSSGVTLYEPLQVEQFRTSYNISEFYKETFQRTLNYWLLDMGRYGPELPGPGVMYGRVRTTSRIAYPDISQSVALEHNVSEFFTALDLEISLGHLTEGNSSSNDHSAKNLLLQKFTALMGMPKSFSQYDINNMLMRKTEKRYLHQDGSPFTFSNYKTKLEKYRYQGLLTERYAEVKNVYEPSYNDWRTFGTLIAREDYPVVQIGTIEYDYVHNTKTSTYNNAFDFYSGAVLEYITSDAYGNNFLTTSVPAYQYYPLMGSGQISGNGKNMLTQLASEKIYRLGENDVAEYLVSATQQVWSNGGQTLNENGNLILQDGTSANSGNVWRQLGTYIWMPTTVAPNGMTALTNFQEFSVSNPIASSENWKNSVSVVLVDPYSHVLSSRDFKNNYASTRYGYDNSKMTLSGTFSRYGEMAFSGAEDSNIINTKKLEVKKGTGTLSSAAYHTGKHSIQVAPDQTAFEYTVPISELTVGRVYTASLWVNKGTIHNVKLYYQLDGVQKAVSLASTQSNKTAGDWTLVHLEFPLTAGTTAKIFAKNDGTTTTFVDDFRFHAKNASSIAYVYDLTTGELTYVLSQNNLYTRFEYNAMGQVVASYREQFGRVPYKSSEIQLNYSTQSFSGLPE